MIHSDSLTFLIRIVVRLFCVNRNSKNYRCRPINVFNVFKFWSRFYHAGIENCNVKHFRKK